MSKLNTLALDLGTKTGWAYSDYDGNITSGTENFKGAKFETLDGRFLRFTEWLNKFYIDAYLCPDYNKLKIVYEKVRRHIGTDAAHVYGAFEGHLFTWCISRGIKYEGVPVGTIKKHITGKGNASKIEVIEAVKKLGFNPVDDNEADALALLNFTTK